MVFNQSFDFLAQSLKPVEAKAYRRKEVPIVPPSSPPRNEESSCGNIDEDISATDMECEDTPGYLFIFLSVKFPCNIFY